MLGVGVCAYTLPYTSSPARTAASAEVDPTHFTFEAAQACQRGSRLQYTAPSLQYSRADAGSDRGPGEEIAGCGQASELIPCGNVPLSSLILSRPGRTIAAPSSGEGVGQHAMKDERMRRTLAALG